MLETGDRRARPRERATPEDIARLRGDPRACWTRARASQHVERDLAFHLEIAAAAHNPVIEMMLESIAVPTAALMFRSVGDPEVMRPQPALPPASPSRPSGRRDPEAAAEADPGAPHRGPGPLRRGLRAQRRRAGAPGPGPAGRADRPRRPGRPRAGRTRRPSARRVSRRQQAVGGHRAGARPALDARSSSTGSWPGPATPRSPTGTPSGGSTGFLPDCAARRASTTTRPSSPRPGSGPTTCSRTSCSRSCS